MDEEAEEEQKQYTRERAQAQKPSPFPACANKQVSFDTVVGLHSQLVQTSHPGAPLLFVHELPATLDQAPPPRIFKKFEQL